MKNYISLLLVFILLLSASVLPGYADLSETAEPAAQVLQENLVVTYNKVWVLCGYYDGATPFYGAEWVYNHVFINDSLQDNLSFTYYPSGHMIYLNADSLGQLHQEAENWFGK